jgi:hypothetical protein
MQREDLQAFVEKRLARYGAMSLAVASGFMAAPAHAGTIAVDTSTWSGTSTADGYVYFNPVMGPLGLLGSSSHAAFRLSHVAAASGSGSRLFIQGVSSYAAVAGASNFVTKFADNAIVPSAIPSFIGGGFLEASDPSNNGAHLGSFNPGDTAYIGLRMNGHFGWARVAILDGFQAQLLGFAYETVEGDPATTSLPEPSTLMMLALGSAGIAAYRRKTAAK